MIMNGNLQLFSLSDEFINAYKRKQPKWGQIGYITYKRCVTEDTPILTRDLRWIAARHIKQGREILAFDEESNDKFNSRYLRVSTILHNKIEKAECVEIELSNGEKLQCTPDHSWLVKKASNKLVWIEAQDLLKNNTKNCYMLRYYDVWKEDKSYEGGFLSAAFDGEGCLDRHRGISFTQVENGMYKRVIEYLNKFNFQYNISKKKKTSERSKQCYVIRITGNDQVSRFLGMFRPPRLLKKYLSYHDEMQMRKQLFRNKEEIKVIKVTPIGKRNIAVISTSTKTHFTGGYPSHNTYARPLPNGNTEEYWQTLKRVVEGVFTIQKSHCYANNLPWSEYKAQNSAQKMFKLMWEFKFTPPGRGLWAMGTDYIYNRGSAALCNCGFASTEHITTNFTEPFCFLMDMSMLGVGIGGDTKGAGKLTIREPKVKEGWVYIVEDSREGWVALLKTLLDSFSGNGELPQKINYDYVRKKGEPLKGFGGISSGPQPLMDMYDDIKALLDKRVGEKIESSDIVDIFNLIGRCVVAGGIRRTAEIMFGDPNDAEFMDLKNPETNKEALYHHRWASNNSIFATVGMDYANVADKTASNGEPGYQWMENAKAYSRMYGAPDNKDYRIAGSNPCNEQSLEHMELCNLCETYPINHESLKDWIETLKYAYMYAKTVTLLPCHNKKTNAIMYRNRRIGCSISGITQTFQKFGRRNLFKSMNAGYNKIQEWDKIYSEWLCIPRSIKTTSVKPSGTVSLLAGTTPGIHYPYSEYYIRNVRFQDTSSLLDVCRKSGYKIEKDKYSVDTYVVSFPIKQEYFDRGTKEVSMWEQLENAAQVQRYWADNQVSVTITFTPEEAKDIKYALELYETRLKGVSFLPRSDHGYEQAPYIEITKEEYEKLSKEVTPIRKIYDDTHEIDEKFCSNDTCLL